ncbi:testis-specific gene 13 protein [Dendropsophus ebraccatus]|uniref:testis-specific gene 13 protein n=1 Tax=Dendropsophus ebraccatus TaxID=150705 RepID=UPI00383213D4
MQDNARSHVAGVCQQFLQDEGVEAIDWPVCSPDLNPNEHIWDVMSRSIHQHHSSFFARMPSSKVVDQICEFRRTMKIMYRASKINQDKAVVIMSNNPLSDFNEWQKNDSPMQYLGKEFIQPKKHLLSHSSECTNIKEEGALNEQGTKAQKKRYRFVTEDTCKKIKGEFSKRFREPKSHVLKGNYNATREIQVLSKNANEHKSSCCSINKNAATACTWESLTYTALMDSRPSITVPGNGSFLHGQPTKWIYSASHSDIDFTKKCATNKS